jgi:hypothetical protein
MFVVESKLTGRLLYPMHLGKIKKVYKSKTEAENDIRKLAPITNPKRIDVVELSQAAQVWLDNYYKKQ